MARTNRSMETVPKTSRARSKTIPSGPKKKALSGVIVVPDDLALIADTILFNYQLILINGRYVSPIDRPALAGGTLDPFQMLDDMGHALRFILKKLGLTIPIGLLRLAGFSRLAAVVTYIYELDIPIDLAGLVETFAQPLSIPIGSLLYRDDVENALKPARTLINLLFAAFIFAKKRRQNRGPRALRLTFSRAKHTRPDQEIT